MILSIIVGILSACWAIIVFLLLTSEKEWDEDPFHISLDRDELDGELLSRSDDD